MTEKKNITYKAETLGLPPLRTVLGDVPDPDPSGKCRPFRPFGENTTPNEVKGTLTKLIGHLKNSEK
jgi:hypothetical protein